MKKSTLLNKFEFKVNTGGITLKDKFPNLANGVYLLTIQVKSEFFIGEILFNHCDNWVFFQLKNQNGEIIQAPTYIREYPCNMLLAQELKDYGLFYFPETSDFRLYKLDSDFYNTLNKNHYEYLEFLKSRKV